MNATTAKKDKTRTIMKAEPTHLKRLVALGHKTSHIASELGVSPSVLTQALKVNQWAKVHEVAAEGLCRRLGDNGAECQILVCKVPNSEVELFKAMVQKMFNLQAITIT